MLKTHLKRYYSTPLSTSEFITLLRNKPILEEQETWDLYKSFIRHSSARIPLESWHFGSFMNLLFNPYIPSYSQYGLDYLEPPASVLLKFKDIEGDFNSLKLKPDKTVASSIVQSIIFSKERPDLDSPVDINTINMLLKQVQNIHPPTKRSVWGIYTKMKQYEERPNVFTYEWLLILFSSKLKDPKATQSIFTKLSRFDDFRYETFLLYVDALAEVNGSPDVLNKIMFRYKKMGMPQVATREDLVCKMLKYWVHQQKPNPCFKLLHQATKNNLTLSTSSVGYLLDACYLLNSEEPINGLEIVEPIVKKSVQGGNWDYYQLLLQYYGRYHSVDNVLRIWKELESVCVQDLQKATMDAILYAFGYLGDSKNCVELLARLHEPSLEMLNSFMNGYLDHHNDQEKLVEIVKDIRTALKL